jgi:hypothetical protein
VREIWDIAWHRFTVIQDVVSDANARIIAVLFYFTILMPFGIVSTLFSDPLRKNMINGEDGKRKHAGQAWFEREPVPTDHESARQQG